MVESYESLNQLIIDTYISGRYGFDKKLVHITSAEASTAGVQIESDRIWINGFDITLRVLQNFGHLISRLEFNSDTFNGDQVKIIGQHINLHCAPSLRELKLNDCIESPFSRWFTEFKRCERIEFRNLARHPELEMHRVFPYVQRLYIETTEMSEMQFLEHRFSHLQQIICDFSNASHSSISRFNNVLLLNEQITELNVISPIDASLLMSVSRSSVRLQSLTISIHPLDFASGQLTEKLHFATVTTLKLQVIGGDIIFSYFPVTFGNLRSLELVCSEFDEHATKMIKQNKLLERLVVRGEVLEYERWLGIIVALPELIEITAQVHENFPDKLAKIDKNVLVTHKHLQRITILLGMFTQRKVYIDSMPEQWKLIDSTVDREMIFVRDVEVGDEGKNEGEPEKNEPKNENAIEDEGP